MRRRTLLALSLATSTLLGCAGRPAEAPAPIEAPRPASSERPPPVPIEGLPPGTYAVGFRSWWELDATRSYDMTFADGTHYAEPGSAHGAARPILVNEWYPAQADAGAPRMTYGEYLDFMRDPSAPRSPGLERFARELAAYDVKVVADEVFGHTEAELDAATKAALATFFSLPTTCVRDAPPAPGRFPLVLYHGGYGSSVEEQSLLCEYLASCGYVVVGSAYEKADGTSFNVDGHETSLADFEFLARRAATWPNVDATRLAAMGHSGGAQAVLWWRATATCSARAVISLDTTQDYYSIRDPRWNHMIEPLRAHPERATGALLVAASPWASFELIDTLDAADRWYFTAPLEHDEFISHGYERLDHAPDDPALIPRTRACHVALCRIVRAFLDAHLQSDRTELEHLTRTWAPLAPDGAAPHVEHARPGELGPDPYPLGSPHPPTPRQLRPLLAAAGIDATLATLRRAHAIAPDHPIFTAQLIWGLTFELVADARIDEARALNLLYRELVPNHDKNMLALYQFVDRFSPRLAPSAWRTLLAIDPDNKVAKERLESLEARER